MKYIYKFLDYEDNIIYIGKTGNLLKRMRQHFFNGHLEKECYENVSKIFFFEIDGKTNQDMMETFLINKYLPKYNTDKKFSEKLELHESNYLSYDEPEWKELFFQFKENDIEISTSPIKPKYYNYSLSIKERCEKLVEQNISNLINRKGLYRYYLKNIVNNIDEFIQYFLLLHKEILYSKNIEYKSSNIDEPINEENSFEYIAFNINKVKTINLQYLLIMAQIHLIINLDNDTYGLLVHNKYTLKQCSEFQS